jgi:hypothetical protein
MKYQVIQLTTVPRDGIREVYHIKICPLDFWEQATREEAHKAIANAILLHAKFYNNVEIVTLDEEEIQLRLKKYEEEITLKLIK